MSRNGVTPRQRAVIEAVERTGTIAEAARELGISTVSAGVTYRRGMDKLGVAVVPPTYREQVETFGPRLEAIEKHLDTLIAAQAALSVTLLDLATEIRAWTARQPLMVEMRPRHQRVADGGPGGLHEFSEAIAEQGRRHRGRPMAR